MWAHGGTIMDVLQTPTPFNRQGCRQCCSGRDSQGSSLALLSPGVGCAGRSGQEPQSCLFCFASCSADSALTSCSLPSAYGLEPLVTGLLHVQGICCLSSSSHEIIRDSSN